MRGHVGTLFWCGVILLGVATLAAPEVIDGEPAWQITMLSLALIAIAILKLRGSGRIQSADLSEDRDSQTE